MKPLFKNKYSSKHDHCEHENCGYIITDPSI